MMRFRHSIFFLILVGAILGTCCAGAQTAQSQTAAAPDPAPDRTPVELKTWGYKAAAGVQLTLKEIHRTDTGKGTKIDYRLESAGFPADKTYGVWMMESGDYKVFLAFSGYSADADGKLICKADPDPKTRCFPTVQVGVHDYHMGEPVNMAVISTDGTVRAYAKAFPFPVQAQDAGCALTVTMANTKATLFNIEAMGFQPGEEVTVTTTAMKPPTKTVQVSDKGSFAFILDYAHGMGGSGSETFTAAAKACHPMVTYEWGKAGMKVQ